jgi:hypothetical protein
VAAQLDALAHEFDSLRAAMTRARRIRSLLFLTFLIFIGGFVFVLYQYGMELQGAEYRDQLSSLAQKKFNENQQEYAGKVTGLVKKVTPIVTDAFYGQAKKDLPSYLKAAQDQRELFTTDIREKIEKRLNAHFEKIVDQHKATLKKEFPAVDDTKLQERVSANLHLVFEKLVKKYYIDDLNAQLVELYDGLEQFPAADEPGKTDARLEDQLIGTLLELLYGDLAKA